MLDTFSWTNGVVFSAPHATVIAAVEPSWNLLAGFAEPGAIFGYVFDGENAVLLRDGGHYTLRPGTFFAVNTGGAELCSPGGRILLVYQPRADFPFQLGAVERVGRLRYIDGCTDSLLVPPWRRPSLNCCGYRSLKTNGRSLSWCCPTTPSWTASTAGPSAPTRRSAQ